MGKEQGPGVTFLKMLRNLIMKSSSLFYVCVRPGFKSVVFKKLYSQQSSWSCSGCATSSSRPQALEGGTR